MGLLLRRQVVVPCLAEGSPKRNQHERSEVRVLGEEQVRKMAAGMYAVGWPLDARPGLCEVPLARPELGSIEDVWV